MKRWLGLVAVAFIGSSLCCLAGIASSAPSVAQELVAHPVVAQQINVRLIDGKTGKAVADQNFTAAWDRMGRAVIRTDGQGVGVVALPSGAKILTLISGPKNGAKLYRIPYSSCSGSAMAFLDVDRVLASGFAPENECSKKIHTAPRPGEVIYYILPLPWYHIDMQ